MRWLLTCALVALAATPGRAEVVDAAAGGFTARVAETIQAPPEVVYRRLVAISGWWGSDHTFSGDARNLTLDVRPGGCWCEALPDGGGVRHMEVVNAVPGRSLVLHGALGPLQAMAVAGALSITLTASPAGTVVEARYAVAGYAPSGLAALAAPVDSVLTAQFARLKAVAESGAPTR